MKGRKNALLWLSKRDRAKKKGRESKKEMKGER
jgi:hypothetical protein